MYTVCDGVKGVAGDIGESAFAFDIVEGSKRVPKEEDCFKMQATSSFSCGGVYDETEQVSSK